MTIFKLLILVLFALVNNESAGLSKKATEPKIFTIDIDNFWMAFDSIQTTSDSIKQLNYITELYINKGTPGLKAFMNARNYTAGTWVSLIKQYPKFWRSVRQNTLLVKSKVKDIETGVKKLAELYPELKDAQIYFTVGGLRSGGTTEDNLVLIGTEIAAADSHTDVSEFPDKWLAGVFRNQTIDNIIGIAIHEYIHTQQKASDKVVPDVLTISIGEGACDFIAELVLGRPLKKNYISYGYKHLDELKGKFKAEMFSKDYSDWLYNGANAKTVADLGYFMGYDICKTYYASATSKKQAIKEIIELNFNSSNDPYLFLKKSMYYPEGFLGAKGQNELKLEKVKLIRIWPFENNDHKVDTSITEMEIFFSKEMGTGYSFDFGRKGKKTFPIKGVIGFSDDRRSIKLKIFLGQNHEYEFIITGNGFKAVDGSQLEENYIIRFSTR